VPLFKQLGENQHGGELLKRAEDKELGRGTPSINEPKHRFVLWTQGRRALAYALIDVIFSIELTREQQNFIREAHALCEQLVGVEKQLQILGEDGVLRLKTKVSLAQHKRREQGFLEAGGEPLLPLFGRDKLKIDEDVAQVVIRRHCLKRLLELSTIDQTTAEKQPTEASVLKVDVGRNDVALEEAEGAGSGFAGLKREYTCKTPAMQGAKQLNDIYISQIARPQQRI